MVTVCKWSDNTKPAIQKTSCMYSWSWINEYIYISLYFLVYLFWNSHQDKPQHCFPSKTFIRHGQGAMHCSCVSRAWKCLPIKDGVVPEHTICLRCFCLKTIVNWSMIEKALHGVHSTTWLISVIILSLLILPISIKIWEETFSPLDRRTASPRAH